MLEQEHRVKVSKSVVNKLLKKHNYRRRKAQKKQTIKSVPNRDAQFLNIKVLVDEYLKSDNPIIKLHRPKRKNIWAIFTAQAAYTLVKSCMPMTMISAVWQKVSLFRMGSTTGRTISATSTWARARIPVSLPVIVCASGGFNMVGNSFHGLLRFWLSVMAVAATARVTTFSRKTCNACQMN